MAFTLAIVATVLIYIWFIEGRGDDRQHFATAIVVGLGIWYDVKHREWGFDWKAFGGASRLAGGWTAVAVAGIFVAGLMAGTIHDRRDFLGTFLWLVIWGAPSSGCCRRRCCATASARRIDMQALALPRCSSAFCTCPMCFSR